MKFKNLYLIGAGGIGSALLERVVRLLQYHPNGTQNIVLIEKDTFSESNLKRQMCSVLDLGKNKATALLETYGLFHINVVEKFINPDTIDQIFENVSCDRSARSLIVMAVDNDATRKLIYTYLEENQQLQFVIINSTNGYSKYQTSLHIPGLTVSPLKRYSNIATPDDYIPGGCAEETPSTPQLLVANSGAAFTVLLIVNSLLENEKFHDEYIGDVLTGQQKGIGVPIKFR